jgi:hypothetical protein
MLCFSLGGALGKVTASKSLIGTFVSSSFYHLQDFANPDRLTPVYLTWIVPPFTHPLEAPPLNESATRSAFGYTQRFDTGGKSPL